jgi:murein DD-endopeptidase MepM/ murein hydrolase activator NlpD
MTWQNSILIMKYFSQNKKKNSVLLKTIFISMVTVIIVAVTPTFYLQTAHAGLFSFLSNVFNAGPVSADTRFSVTGSSSADQQNTLQEMPILEAASNPDPNPNNCGDISPVNGTILDPNISASTIASCGNTSTQISTYVVNSGDTISTVAHMFNVSVNTILWANNLNGKSVLQPGQTLVILPISGINYVVKKGDSLKSIANKYGGNHVSDTLSDILSYNDVSINSQLQIDQTIIIPSAEISSSELAGKPSYPTKSSGINPRALSTEALLDSIKNWPSYESCNSPIAGCYYLRPIQGGHLSQKLHLHNAVDLAAPVGTPILAAADGTVIISRIDNAWNGGYGNFVVISHTNGSQSLYAHMQLRKVVSAGQHVSQGDLIGYIGMTGETFGPHVHFEIRGAQNEFWSSNPQSPILNK